MTDIATITDPVSRAFALAAGEGETSWWESQLFTIKCSDGGPGLVDCTLEAPRRGPGITGTSGRAVARALIGAQRPAARATAKSDRVVIPSFGNVR